MAMNFSTFVGGAMVCLSLLATANKCADPGQPGETEHITISLSDGSVLGKSNYGLWRADAASGSCRWWVEKDGRVVASGGPLDMIISGTSTKGGVLHARGCGKFMK